MTVPAQRPAASDAVLLRRVAGGDQTAFRELYDQHAPACRHRARFVLASHELVDDVVQSVFLDVWTQAARFDVRRGSTRGWLLRLTHHKAVDAVRAQQRHVARHAREQLLRAEPEQVAPDDVAVRAEEDARLRSALARLPRLQRDVLVLCYFHHLSQREAALALGVPIGTIKSRAHTGVLRLRLLLADVAPSATEPVPPVLVLGGVG